MGPSRPTRGLSGCAGRGGRRGRSACCIWPRGGAGAAGRVWAWRWCGRGCRRGSRCRSGSRRRGGRGVASAQQAVANEVHTAAGDLVRAGEALGRPAGGDGGPGWRQRGSGADSARLQRFAVYWDAVQGSQSMSEDKIREVRAERAKAGCCVEVLVVVCYLRYGSLRRRGMCCSGCGAGRIYKEPLTRRQVGKYHSGKMCWHGLCCAGYGGVRRYGMLWWAWVSPPSSLDCMCPERLPL